MFCYSSLPRYKSSQDYHKMYKRILHIGNIHINMRNGEKKDEIKKQTSIRCSDVFCDLGGPGICSIQNEFSSHRSDGDRQNRGTTVG